MRAMATNFLRPPPVTRADAPTPGCCPRAMARSPGGQATSAPCSSSQAAITTASSATCFVSRSRAALLSGPAPQLPVRRVITCASAPPRAAGSGATPPHITPVAPYWRSHVSRKPLLLQSLYDCLANIRKQETLPEQIDVAMVYVSSAYEEDYGLLVEALRQQLPGLRNVFGCTGFGIIGVDEDGAQEVEAQPALSLTLMAIPQAEVVVRHIDVVDLPDGDAAPDRWSSLLGVPAFPEAPLSLVVLSDPSFTAVQDLLAGLDFAFPTATKIGGLSSAAPSFTGSTTATFSWSACGASSRATTPAAAVADCDQQPSSTGRTTTTTTTATDGAAGGKGAGVHLRGAAVMSIHGEVQMDLMIAQGCRPLTTTTWTVDRVAPGDPTRIMQLSSEDVAKGRPLPALEAFQVELQSVLSGMSEVELRRTVSNLTVGMAPEGFKQSLEPQDFLIRTLRGFDSEQCLVVGDYLRVGQRIRFMVRDKQGAQEDLTSHGLAYKRKQLQGMMQGGADQQPPPFGMLLFTCNGRGSGLYGEDSYDARTVSTYVPVPCAGFQCNGEIGRVGNTTHLHGFTCAVGVLRLTSEVAGAAGSASAAAASLAQPKQPEQQQE